MSEPVSQDRKKPYSAPAVEKVPLRPEEAVLGACKSTLVAGPMSGRCKPPAIPPCSSLGS